MNFQALLLLYIRSSQILNFASFCATVIVPIEINWRFALVFIGMVFKWILLTQPSAKRDCSQSWTGSLSLVIGLYSWCRPGSFVVFVCYWYLTAILGPWAPPYILFINLLYHLFIILDIYLMLSKNYAPIRLSKFVHVVHHFNSRLEQRCLLSIHIAHSKHN